MANPIKKIKRIEYSEEEIQEQNVAEVMQAISENKDSVIKGIDLLSTVNESGTLDIISALIKKRKVALENLVTELNKERYAGSIENLSELFMLLGSINTEQIEELLTKMNQGIEDAQFVSETETTSYMDLFRAIKDPEINKSITMLLEFLRVMGRD